MEDLVYSFQEGNITLNELLNAIHTYSDGIHNYYKLMITYYHDIFELEAMTGRKLVNF